MKRFLLLFLPLALLVSALMAYLGWRLADAQVERWEARETTQLKAGALLLEHDLASTLEQLQGLDQDPALLRALAAPPQQARARMEELLQILLYRNAPLHQARWIGPDGMERARVIRVDATGQQVAPDELLDKSDRPYFTEAIRLQPGQFYMSALDLTVEHGRIEVPHRPTLRLAIRLRPTPGQDPGLLLVNLEGSRLLESLSAVMVEDKDSPHYMLLNSAGAILQAPDSQEAWGEQLGRDNSLARRQPQAWARMAAAPSGRWEDDSGLWLWDSIEPAQLMPGRLQVAENWKLVTHLEPDQLRQLRCGDWPLLALNAGVILLLLAFGVRRYGRLLTANDVAAAELKGARALQQSQAELQQSYDQLLQTKQSLRELNADLERQVAERTAQFQLLAENASDVVFRANASCQLDWISPSVTELLGWQPDELIGQPLIDLVHPDTHAAFHEAGQRLQQHESVNFEARVSTGDGGFRWVAFGARGLFDPAGALQAYACSWRDIQSEVEARQQLYESLHLLEQALAEATASQARFRAIFEQAPIGIALLDPRDGQIQDCNERYAAIAGRSVEELRCIGCMAITHPDDLTAAMAQMGRLDAGEIPSFQMDARFLKPDGSQVWVRRTVAPVQMEAGSSSMLLCMVQDISQQKQAELDLLAAKEAAEQASRAKGDFVANMSHEVRTPMNAVLGFLDILADTRLDAEQRTLVAKVQKSSKALLRILNDILDHSKLDAGAVELELAPFELDEVLRDATELLALTASAKGLELVLDVPPELPRCYRGDALRLGQVLLNLLGNAVKFTERGSVQLAVRAQGETEDGRSRLRFEVRDSGIGMTAEQVERLFRPFVQADNSTTRRFGGTGLGLTIAKRLVELMGGEIGVDSQPGQGTTFWFSVPLAAATEEPTPALAKPAPPATRQADSIRGARLLLVEDNPTNQEIALSLLGRMGLQVTVANHGREALEQLAGQRFDLVLMDLQMPVMDGFEATAAIRATDWGRQLPIVAMTAAAFDDDRRRVLDAGMNDFVSKPVDSRRLLDVLLRWLPHRPLQDLSAAAGVSALPDAADATPAAAPALPAATQALLPTELEGFELDRTLERLDHDQTLLLRALRQFLRDFPADDWVAQFDAACRQADWVSAQRQAHTLKGVAGSLGAVRVQQAATALDALLKTAASQSGCDPDQLAQRRDDCLQALRAAIAELQDKLPPEAATAQSATGPAQPEAALQDLAEAEQLLGRNRGLPAALLPRLRAHLGQHAARAQFDRLTDQVSAFDFDGALETIRAMRERLSS